MFFREVPGDGPIGAERVVLTPERSLAVDRAFIALAVPIWVEADERFASAEGVRRLVVAQDTGGAIKGPVRGDLFWGTGSVAASRAGVMNARGRYYLLLPRSVAGRLIPGGGNGDRDARARTRRRASPSAKRVGLPNGRPRLFLQDKNRLESPCHAPVPNGPPLFLLFLQEINSDGPLLRRRNPRFPMAWRRKEQRDNGSCRAVRLVVNKSAKIPGCMVARDGGYSQNWSSKFTGVAKIAYICKSVNRYMAVFPLSARGCGARPKPGAD